MDVLFSGLEIQPSNVRPSSVNEFAECRAMNLSIQEPSKKALDYNEIVAWHAYELPPTEWATQNRLHLPYAEDLEHVMV